METLNKILVISKKDGKKYYVEIYGFDTIWYYICNEFLNETKFSEEYILLSEHRKNILKGL